LSRLGGMLRRLLLRFQMRGFVHGGKHFSDPFPDQDG
jgi:hypothetical protein